jgi:hypothetical protein
LFNFSKELVDMSCYDYDVDQKADKTEIANNFYEIRQLIIKSLDDFMQIQKSKLEEFCNDLENYNSVATEEDL